MIAIESKRTPIDRAASGSPANQSADPRRADLSVLGFEELEERINPMGFVEYFIAGVAVMLVLL